MRDHTGKNAVDLLNVIVKAKEKLPFIQEYQLEGDVALHKPNQVPQGPGQNEFDLHGDDSSDEEVSDTKNYDVKRAWEAFKISPGFQQLRGNLAEQDIQLIFIVQNVGINFLYQAEVNKHYYAGGKKLLGNNGRPHDETLKKWIRDSLFETIKQVNFSNNMTATEEEEVMKYLDGDKEHPGVIATLVENIHKLLRVTDLRLAKERSIEYIEGQEKVTAKDKKKIFGEIREAHKLARRRESSIIEVMPEKVLAEYKTVLSPNKEANKKSFKGCVVELMEQARITNARRVLNFNARNDLKQAEKPADVRELFDIFTLLFYSNLRNLRHKYSIMFVRGANEQVVYDLSQNHENSVAWFSGMRVSNRLYKRKVKNRENKHFLLHPNREKEPKISLGYCLTDYSFWKLPQDIMVLSKEQISTNQWRSHFVDFASSDKTKYEELAKYIDNNFVNKGISAQEVAKQIRTILRGGMPSFQDPQHNKFVSELTYLLFFCETARNPAAFCIHQMMLDLIIEASKEWKNFFAGAARFSGGIMPMSMTEAVKTANYLSSLLARYMPFPYQYGDNKDDKEDALKELLVRSKELVREWFDTFVDDQEDIWNILEVIKEKEWYIFPDKEVTDTIGEVAKLTMH